MATSIVSVALLLSALGAVLPAARSTISLPVVDPLPHDATNYSSGPSIVNFADLAASNHSTDYHALSCPRLEFIVTTEVDVAIDNDYKIAAGLIRIYFNDCFPQGCDASLLLKGPWSEERFPPNAFLNQKAMQLIEDIRIVVHNECGPTVSCADILALATRRAVVHANGYTASYHVQLGRYDNVAPAIMGDVIAIPLPQSGIDTLLNDFASRGLGDPSDLVALSGAHSIGKAHCASFRDRAAQYNTDFTRKLFWDCRRDANALEDLDHATPLLLDNQYYKNLYKGEGLFTSDMALLSHPDTAKWVKYYNDYPYQFINHFSSKMEKLYYAPKGGYGEIRRFTCFRSNIGWLADQGEAGHAADSA